MHWPDCQGTDDAHDTGSARYDPADGAPWDVVAIADTRVPREPGAGGALLEPLVADLSTVLPASELLR